MTSLLEGEGVPKQEQTKETNSAHFCTHMTRGRRSRYQKKVTDVICASCMPPSFVRPEERARERKRGQPVTGQPGPGLEPAPPPTACLDGYMVPHPFTASSRRESESERERERERGRGGTGREEGRSVFEFHLAPLCSALLRSALLLGGGSQGLGWREGRRHQAAHARAPR